MTDHDLLMRIDERVESLSTHFSNHIRHHWMLTICLLIVIGGLVVAVLTH